MPNAAFMRRCLVLASQGRWNVGNGALVGAVLVRDEKIIAEGYHPYFGGPHAERMLLENFDGEILPSDVLYVNLEPCCHTGKTPPCNDIILERGVRQVIYGMRDPDARVAGKGSAMLQAQGVHVMGPFLRAECEFFNRGFTSVRTVGRPWVTIKMAKESSGRISNDNGSSLKITSQQQDEWSHTWLRAKHDAILVGVQTVINDNPLLNTRFDRNAELLMKEGLGLNPKNLSYKNSIQNSPLRIILDPHLRMPLESRVCDVTRQPTMLCVFPESMKEHARKVEVLRSKGVWVMGVAAKDAAFEWHALWHALLMPSSDYHGITSLLVEGGARTWQRFLGAGMVDEHISLTSPVSS